MFQGQANIIPTKTTAMKLQKQNSSVCPGSTQPYFSSLSCFAPSSLLYRTEIMIMAAKQHQHRSLTWIKNSAAI